LAADNLAETIMGRVNGISCCGPARFDERDVLAPGCECKGMRVIEAKKVKAIVDKYVEVLQKVVPRMPRMRGSACLSCFKSWMTTSALGMICVPAWSRSRFANAFGRRLLRGYAGGALSLQT